MHRFAESFSDLVQADLMSLVFNRIVQQRPDRDILNVAHRVIGIRLEHDARNCHQV